MSNATDICCLCGKPATDENPMTREHVPPKQFYPKKLRHGLNLWTVPTHRTCNNRFKNDEEYFYHVLYPLVANTNSQMADVVHDDLKRRAKQPQTRAIMRSILSTAERTTSSGLFLPPGMVRMSANEGCLEQVAIKIGRCLFVTVRRSVLLTCLVSWGCNQINPGRISDGGLKE